MNVLSLYDGMSCGQIALDRLGITPENYFASEIDKYAIATTLKNYPNTIQLGDITEIDFTKFKGKINLAMGGSPCTYWSIAKQDRETTCDGEGYRLFMQYVRAVRESEAKYFLYENNYRIHKDIQKEITKELGVEPIMINSSLVSAQSRERLYWTNIPVTQPEDKGIALSDVLESEVDDKYYINTDRAIEICNLEAQSGKIAYIGKDSMGNRVYSIHGKSVTLKAEGGGWGAKTGLYWIPCLTPDRVNKRQQGQRFRPSNAKFYTLTTQDKHGILMHGQIRKVTPLEAERLQTVPENYTEGVSDTQRYRMLGNGWTVDVIAHILKGMTL